MSTGDPIFPKKNGPASDLVMTPLDLARRCVQVLAPTGRVLEPCAGPQVLVDGQLRRGGFYHALLEARLSWDIFDDAQNGIHVVDYCEWEDGLDFLHHAERAQWIITNPPFSKYLSFAEHAFELAPNVAFLAPVERALRLSIQRRAKASGHVIRAVWETPWPAAWKQSKVLGGYGINTPDMAFGLVWWQRGYRGARAWNDMPELQVLEEPSP